MSGTVAALIGGICGIVITLLILAGLEIMMHGWRNDR